MAPRRRPSFPGRVGTVCHRRQRAWRPGLTVFKTGIPDQVGPFHDAALALARDHEPGAHVLAIAGVTCVARDPDWIFQELHDPEKLVGCVPGAQLTRLVDQRSFEARIVVGVGPVKIAYAGSGRIVASNPKRRTASLTLDGRSLVGMPAVRVRMTMAIQRRTCGSAIRMAFTVGISDRTGLLSQGWLDPIARELVDRTISRIKQQLEVDAPPPRPPAA